ncbi:hypothetical protein [Endozoicomonas sp. 4G]|nr:hypothetical protein [Endozoicomonas sp. 4G]
MNLPKHELRPLLPKKFSDPEDEHGQAAVKAAGEKAIPVNHTE